MKKYTVILFHKDDSLFAILHYENERFAKQIKSLADKHGNKCFVLYTGTLIPAM